MFFMAFQAEFTQKKKKLHFNANEWQDIHTKQNQIKLQW